MNSDTKLYEVSYVLKAENEEDAARNLDDLKKYIGEKNGMNLEESRPTKRRLAYPLGKVTEAFSGIIKFFLKPEDVKNIEEFLGREKNFLRYILTATTRHSEKPAKPKKMRRITEKSASDIKEIDKRLEEILGK